jgi:hypothetical protein
VARTVDRHLEDAHRVLRELSQLGIDMDRIGSQLQQEGIELFVRESDGAVATVDDKRRRLLEGEGG